MHNDNKNSKLRLAIAIGLLLSGVVCGAAISAFSSADIPLPLKKPFGFQLGLDTKAAQTESTSLNDTILPEETPEAVRGSAGYNIVSKAIVAELRQGRPSYALKVLEGDPTAKKLKNSEYDRVKALIAQSFLMEGKVDKAGAVAGQAVLRSGKYVPLAGWVAGQSAWRKGDFKKAADMFGIAAKSPTASAWLVSGSAYWAARSLTRLGKTDQATAWHEVAANYPRTFYGLISLRTLGRNYDFNWDVPELSHDDRKDLGQNLKVSAALRMSREGQLSAAITSISSTKWMRSDDGRRALLAYFQYKKDPALTLYMARLTRDENGRLYDTALYPESPWEPREGYEVDKALVHALIRQESRFNPHAVSSTGATGLMQIMPATAQYISVNADKPLSHPETNIEIGQKYVKVLLKDKSVNNDLFKMAVAYNAGPGNLQRWKNDLKNVDDPMLFIESIPSGETRAFVERVMVNYWIYRMRMGQDIPSLEAVASLDRELPDKTASASSETASFDNVAMAETE